MLEKIETNSQVAQIISPNEMVALITFNIKLGNVEGMLNLCIPHIVIEPIMDKLNTRFWFAQNERVHNHEYEKNIEHMIQYTKMPIKAVLGKTHITVKEFLELQTQDIISLDKDIESDIDLYVGQLLKFKGQVGTYKNKSAVKITEVIKREDD